MFFSGIAMCLFSCHGKGIKSGLLVEPPGEMGPIASALSSSLTAALLRKCLSWACTSYL